MPFAGGAVNVRWTRLAIADLDDAYEYIATEDPSSASMILERIELAIQAVCRHPHSGRSGRVEGTRELVVTGTPFIVPYRVRGRVIEILAIMHGARRWPDCF